MLRQRVITALIGLPLLIVAVWFGTPWFTLLVAAMAIIGALEFYQIASNANIKPITYLGIVWVILLVISPHCPYHLATSNLFYSPKFNEGGESEP